MLNNFCRVLEQTASPPEGGIKLGSCNMQWKGVFFSSAWKVFPVFIPLIADLSLYPHLGRHSRKPVFRQPPAPESVCDTPWTSPGMCLALEFFIYIFLKSVKSLADGMTKWMNENALA